MSNLFTEFVNDNLFFHQFLMGLIKTTLHNLGVNRYRIVFEEYPSINLNTSDNNKEVNDHYVFYHPSNIFKIYKQNHFDKFIEDGSEYDKTFEINLLIHEPESDFLYTYSILKLIEFLMNETLGTFERYEFNERAIIRFIFPQTFDICKSIQSFSIYYDLSRTRMYTTFMYRFWEYGLMDWKFSYGYNELAMSGYTSINFDIYEDNEKMRLICKHSIDENNYFYFDMYGKTLTFNIHFDEASTIQMEYLNIVYLIFEDLKEFISTNTDKDIEKYTDWTIPSITNLKISMNLTNKYTYLVNELFQLISDKFKKFDRIIPKFSIYDDSSSLRKNRNNLEDFYGKDLEDVE